MGKVIVIMGAPGAGKGTQSRLLSEQFGFPQISTGDILREMAEADSSLGRGIKATLANGQFVSDKLLTNVILERTSQADCAEGYILDGFPRTLNQANLLEDLAQKQGKSILLFRVKVHKEILMQRLTGRRTCPHCGEIFNIHFKEPKQPMVCDICGTGLIHRTDDNEATVAKRLRTYVELTTPLFDYYKQSGRLIELNGEQPAAQIFSQISGLLNN